MTERPGAERKVPKDGLGQFCIAVTQDHIELQPVPVAILHGIIKRDVQYGFSSALEPFCAIAGLSGEKRAVKLCDYSGQHVGVVFSSLFRNVQKRDEPETPVRKQPFDELQFPVLEWKACLPHYADAQGRDCLASLALLIRSSGQRSLPVQDARPARMKACRSPFR
ncbi:hypothetical protein [Nitratireductor aquibiodomus]|uniref:hypothetical protein n=1 Tax=Nitratireductor aquibiodomus TaxID=204799 RepID=UPI001FCA864D|nr:hypothetical protein [Nitratireductor aquibiodomus]